MFYLYPNSTRILAARDRFHQGVIDIVYARLDLLPSIMGYDFELVDDFFSNCINDYLDDILKGDPITIWKINSRLNGFIHFSPALKKAVEYVFNYIYFRNKDTVPYSAYELANDLQINTCTYCNRNYTSTVITKNRKKVIRPEFDHYFDKAKNPLLALSFYNLIPCCLICNSRIKHTKPLSLATHLHPYIDDSNPDFQFSFTYGVRGSNNIEIKVNAKTGSKAEKTAEFFKLQDVYNAHTSELMDLLKLRDFYSARYLMILKGNLPSGIAISDDEMYRIIFGSEYDSTKFINRPFSKFKFDILKEIGII